MIYDKDKVTYDLLYWEGETYTGLPCFNHSDELCIKGKSWSELLDKNLINRQWCKVELLAYLNSFKNTRALIFCIACKDKENQTKSGYIYSSTYSDVRLQDIHIGDYLYFELRPTRYSLCLSKRLSAEDVEKQRKEAEQTTAQPVK